MAKWDQVDLLLRALEARISLFSRNFQPFPKYLRLKNPIIPPYAYHYDDDTAIIYREFSDKNAMCSGYDVIELKCFFPLRTNEQDSIFHVCKERSQPIPIYIIK